MGVSRQFLNLIVDNRVQGAKSLRCMDLRRYKLFNTRTPELPPPKGNRSESEFPPQDDRKNSKQAAAFTGKIREIQLPRPIMNFQGTTADGSSWNPDCLPLAGRKLLFVDRHLPSCRTELFDVKDAQVESIPDFYVSKDMPLPWFVQLPSNADATDDDDDDGGKGSFYMLAASPFREELQGDDARQQLSKQFQAFVYNSESKSWQRQLLPPPPFVCDPKSYERITVKPMHREPYKRPDITSYAVVERGGSHVILVSAADGAGTYCLDTVTHTWSKVGDWVLPFTGKVEYVPELKLWFGICAQGWHLGAADLSTMDSQSQPQLVGTWKELEEPGGWWLLPKRPQLVSLGSGRFCITKFFTAYTPAVEYFTILTGIDVVPCIHDVHGTANDTSTFSGGNGSEGKAELLMVKHNSRMGMLGRRKAIGN